MVPRGDGGVIETGNDDGAIDKWDERLGSFYVKLKLAEDIAKEGRKRLAEERRKGHLPVIPSEDWVPPKLRGKVLDFRTRTLSKR